LVRLVYWPAALLISWIEARLLRLIELEPRVVMVVVLVSREILVTGLRAVAARSFVLLCRV